MCASGFQWKLQLWREQGKLWTPSWLHKLNACGRASICQDVCRSTYTKEPHLNHHYLYNRIPQPLTSGCFSSVCLRLSHQKVSSSRVLWYATIDLLYKAQQKAAKLSRRFYKRLQAGHIIFSISYQLGNSRHQVDGYLILFSLRQADTTTSPNSAP